MYVWGLTRPTFFSAALLSMVSMRPLNMISSCFSLILRSHNVGLQNWNVCMCVWEHIHIHTYIHTMDLQERQVISDVSANCIVHFIAESAEVHILNEFARHLHTYTYFTYTYIHTYTYLTYTYIHTYTYFTNTYKHTPTSPTYIHSLTSATHTYSFFSYT